MAKSTNVILGLLGAAVLVGGAAVAYMFMGKPKAAAPAAGTVMPGYTVLPNCAGITITGQSEAMKFAKSKGAEAELFNQAASTAWLAKAGGALGIQLSCLSAKMPTDSLRFSYNLARWYLVGAVSTLKITNPAAVTLLGYLRTQMLSYGVPADQLPEGLG